MATPFLRAYRPADRDAIGQICVLTGDSGADATGKFGDDQLLGDIYALPYVDRHPEFAFVIDLDGEAVGYVIAAPDTEDFNAWFRAQWWPEVSLRYSALRECQPDQAVLANADAVGAEPTAYAAEFPAHLHIDLLPVTRGGGWGRKSMEALFAALTEAGIPGVHLVASATNANAIAFYERLGLERLPSDAGAAAFGKRLG